MNRLRPDDLDARFIRRVLIVAAIAGVLWALFRAGDILILAFGSSLGAIAIHAIAEGYEKRLRLPPKVALGAGIATALG
ncbi:MAG TPA: AI-2E family transporter, partial [Sphingomonas sp.]